MISSARNWMGPVLLFSLAGCGLKGPLYLPDARQEEIGAAETTAPASPGVSEGRKVRTLPPAPQSQKEDRERIEPSRPPTTPSPPPVSPPDPDRPSTTPPPGP